MMLPVPLKRGKGATCFIYFMGTSKNCHIILRRAQDERKIAEIRQKMPLMVSLSNHEINF